MPICSRVCALDTLDGCTVYVSQAGVTAAAALD